MIISYLLPLSPPKRFETRSNSITFGRNPFPDQHVDIDLVEDDYVSHLHACITCENDEYWIEDLGSANGTWVNGQAITVKTMFAADDKVQVGWTIIEVQMETAFSISEVEPDSITVINPPMETAAPVAEQEPVSAALVDTPLDSASPVSIPDAEGSIVDFDDITTHPHIKSGEDAADKMMLHTWRQLKAFNDLSQMIGTAATFNSLTQILVKHLQETIPNAQRGAILLPDERGNLLLKAHWPLGNHSVSMTWIRRAFDQHEAFVWTAPAESVTNVDTPHSAIYYSVQSAIYVPLILGDQVLGVMCVDNLYARQAFSPTDLELLKSIAGQVAMLVGDRLLRQDIQRKEALLYNLSRQFSPKIAKRMLEKQSHLQIGGQRVDPVTILVSDVRNFTALSAKMEPDDVVRMLNEMFDAFVPIVFEYDGVVDKYVGDSVLAVFGSPEQDNQQWEKAVWAALEIAAGIKQTGRGKEGTPLARI